MAAAAGKAGPPKLVNLYNLRTVGTARPCSMCGKDTTKCLANADVTDVIYCCLTHLSDPGFAKPAPTEQPSTTNGTSSPTSSTSATTKVTQEDIDRVKKEYEDRQQRKKEASSSTGANGSTASKGWLEAGLSTGWSVAKTGAKALSETVTPLFSPPPSAASEEATRTPAVDLSTCKTFVLHRHVFQLRVDQARRRWQAKQAAVQSREAIDRLSSLDLPSVPTTPIPKGPA